MNDNVFARILGWLRAGYPEGLPQQDYVALLGVLARRLTPQEVDTVAHRLVADGDIAASDEEIENMIREIVLTPPDEKDVRRVAARLAAGGWPLESHPVATADER